MPEDFRIRAMGLGLTVSGLALGWWLILGPLRDAMSGAPEVEVHWKALFVAPLLLITGGAFLFYGAGLPLRGADPDKQRRAGFILFGIIAVLAGLIYWGLKSQLAALGYG